MANVKIISLTITDSSIIIGYDNGEVGWSTPNPGINAGGYGDTPSGARGIFCTTPGNACGQCQLKRDSWNTNKDIICSSNSLQFSVGHAMYETQGCGECVLLKCDDSIPNSIKCKNYDSFLHIRTDVGYGGIKTECPNMSTINDALSSDKKCAPAEDNSYNGLNSAELTTSFVDDHWTTHDAQCKMWYRYKKVDCNNITSYTKHSLLS